MQPLRKERPAKICPAGKDNWYSSHQTASKHTADFICPENLPSQRHGSRQVRQMLGRLKKKKKRKTNTFLKIVKLCLSSAGNYGYQQQKAFTSHWKTLREQQSAGMWCRLPAQWDSSSPAAWDEETSLTTLVGSETFGNSFWSSSLVSTSAASRCCCLS